MVRSWWFLRCRWGLCGFARLSRAKRVLDVAAVLME
jgi:hypothetical protein